MSEKYWIDLKCLSMLRLRFKLCKIVWEHVMLQLFMFYEEKYVLNDFKVFDLFSFKGTWFSNSMISAWYNSEIYTGQAHNIEHVV
jgi:hypothetical protein